MLQVKNRISQVDKMAANLSVSNLERANDHRLMKIELKKSKYDMKKL